MLILCDFEKYRYLTSLFERPEFQAMMHDVEEGNANCIIVKDLSRLGRNDVQANLYYEDIFIARGIRFIAIDDGVDT